MGVGRSGSWSRRVGEGVAVGGGEVLDGLRTGKNGSRFQAAATGRDVVEEEEEE